VFVLLIETCNSESYRAARAGSLRDWYERLGHVHVDAIQTMARTEAVEGLQVDGDEENLFCGPCMVAKQSRLAHSKSERKRNLEADEFVYTDLCGGFEMRSLGGAYFYFVPFKDDGTGPRSSYRASRRYRRR